MAGNGQGSVYHASGQRRLPWCAVVTTGWTIGGRPVRAARFAETQAEAEGLRRDMLAAMATARPIPDDRLTLRAYLPAFLTRRTDLRATTLRTWRTAADHLLRRLGTRHLRRLAPSEVDTALADMPPGIAVIARTLLVVALGDAERDGLLERNVARLSRAPRHARAERPTPTAEDARRLVEAARGHRLGALITAALGSALREGELLGLTRDALDLDGGTAHVDWQLVWVAGEPVLTRPKTAAARRTVSLPPFVVAALRTHLAGQAAERLAAGRGWRDADGLVFTRRDGGPLHPNTARYVLDVLCRRAGVTRTHFHGLRHSALTLIAASAGQKAAQVAAGHRNITTTDIYAHGTDDLRRAAAQALQEAIG